MIKVEVNKDGKVMHKYEYPFIGKAKRGELIILFSEEGTGIVINGTPGCPIGDYSAYWSMELYEKFEGEITLKNED